MPKINRKYLSEKPIKYKREYKEEAKSFYSSIAWKRLRDTYISTHPICEICVSKGHVEPATDVHHRYFWQSFNTEELKWQKFLDENNLCACCSPCHYALHTKARRYGINFADSLTDKEWEEAHNV